MKSRYKERKRSSEYNGRAQKCLKLRVSETKGVENEVENEPKGLRGTPVALKQACLKHNLCPPMGLKWPRTSAAYSGCTLEAP